MREVGTVDCSEQKRNRNDLGAREHPSPQWKTDVESEDGGWGYCAGQRQHPGESQKVPDSIKGPLQLLSLFWGLNQVCGRQV